ncbi:GTPase IMAP family member 8 [Biomphalaria pfeifferi]|uniref:GTPase IMAP family member 8 n=1 Tax=Biomphalaria pfeifferi TaxID=112525 RepID=A0AAD8B2H5_BIOPF|nr:GTPase IMAP family member 8 [Biomphalaria pfeifferi]
MRPVKELVDVAKKLEVLEDIVEQLQCIIADIRNVITKCSSWIDENDDTTYQAIKQMLVSKTCEYVKQFFLMAHENNDKLSEPVNTKEEMNTVTGIQTIEAPGSDIKGSLDYKRLQESVKEITASIKSHSEMIEVLQKRNKSLVKENINEIAANVKKHSDMIESLQENISDILSTQNQFNEHYKEIMEELSVASSFMSNLKDENIKLKLELKDYNKKVDDVSDRVYKGMEIVSEFAKDQHILNELQIRNKELTEQSTKDQLHLDELRKEIQKLTDDSVELRQHLDNAKESIERFKEENAKHQASLEKKEFENQRLTEKLGFFPKDILKRCKKSLIDVRKKNINFLLLGQCGIGKSALGNSILQRECFKVSSSTKPRHKEVQCEMGEFKGRGIQVFELPVPYFAIDEKQSMELLFKATKNKIVDQCSHGFFVILLLFRFDSIITDEDFLWFEAFKTTFGQNSLKDYGVLVMTCGDDWKLEYEEEKSFQEWIQHQGHLKKILPEFNGRALLFENHTRVKGEQTEQLQNLMDMVDKLILDNTFQTKSLTF